MCCFGRGGPRVRGADAHEILEGVRPLRSVIWAIAATVAAAAIALSVVEVVHRVVRRLGRRSLLLTTLTEHSHRPLQVTATVLAVRLAVQVTTGHGADPPWRRVTLH